MPIDVSRLRVSVEEGERWRRTLRITVPSELMRQEKQAAMRKLASRLRIPGFRAGKVPAAVLEKRFGPALEQELLDRVIGDAFRGVLEEQALRPISEGEVGDISYQAEADLTFQVSFDIAPQIELPRLGGFRVERPSLPVPEEEVDKVLERVREQEGTWVPVEDGAPASGERVSVRIQRLDVEEDEPRKYEFVLGGGEAIPEVERAIEGLTVGASGEFEISLPGEPGAGSDDAGESAPRRLRIFLDGRKRLELPELNDDLARAAGDFESLEQLRARIREDLEKEAGREEEGRLRAALLEQILTANPFEVPESMVDQYVRAALGSPKEPAEERFQEAKEQLGPHARVAVKRHLVVNRIAELHELAATEEEVDARVEEIATRAKTDPAEVYGRLQKAGQIESLEREIMETKVFDYLKSQSTIVGGE